MKLKKEFIVRNIMGDNILVPRGSTALNFNGLITLNEVALDIWSLIPQAQTEADIVDALLQMYDVDAETCTADVAEFMQTLRNADII